MYAVLSGRLKVSNVEFDSHYWKGTVTNDEGKSMDNVRLDYVLNYLRVPSTLKSDAVVAVQEKVAGNK